MASGRSIKLSENLLLGVGSSAYQIEGGWDADGKAPSIWDQYLKKKQIKVTNPALVKSDVKKENTIFHKGVDILEKDPENCYSIVNGDIACDSYNKIDEDIKNLVDLGVNVYRFSISWPRVLPKVDDRFPNEAGIKYYKDLIQKLLDNKIQPMVTMYHWDLPNSLQELGGWSNPYIIEIFKNYATFLFKTFGEQVKLWSTFNEPRFVADAYGQNDGMAPAIGHGFSGFGEYMVIRNVLLSHAAVYKVYKNSFKAKQQGKISLCLDTAAYFPQNPNLEEHRKIAVKAYDFYIGIFVQPLVNGEYPKSVTEAIKETNKRENIYSQRIVEFNDKEKEDLIGSYDFIAFNYYNSFKLRPMTEDEYKRAESIKTKDMGITLIANDENMKDTFNGFTEVINWFVKTCNNPSLFIAENGIHEVPGEDESQKKIEYHQGILTELDKAMKKGIDIQGYCVWSFMDSLEWVTGYFKRLYGIYSVDFNDPMRPRTKKPSFEFFEKLFKTRTFTTNVLK